mgnify:CR=1 FL=1
METQEIYSVLKKGSHNQIRSLIETAPENSFKDFALGMADAHNLATWIVKLTSIISLKEFLCVNIMSIYVLVDGVVK